MKVTIIIEDLEDGRVSVEPLLDPEPAPGAPLPNSVLVAHKLMREAARLLRGPQTPELESVPQS